jgi:hypothetical protein
MVRSTAVKGIPQSLPGSLAVTTVLVANPQPLS